VQRPGKQQKVQHALHERAVEVDLLRQVNRILMQPWGERPATIRPSDSNKAISITPMVAGSLM
jgi:hypothetical protein